MKCQICKKDVTLDNPEMPFCSDRCRLIDLGNWETEHSGGTWISDQFTLDMLEITQVLRNSAKSYVKWSLALNQNLGPDLTQNDPPLGGCNACTPIVTINSTCREPCASIPATRPPSPESPSSTQMGQWP